MLKCRMICVWCRIKIYVFAPCLESKGLILGLKSNLRCTLANTKCLKLLSSVCLVQLFSRTGTSSSQKSPTHGQLHHLKLHTGVHVICRADKSRISILSTLRIGLNSRKARNSGLNPRGDRVLELVLSDAGRPSRWLASHWQAHVVGTRKPHNKHRQLRSRHPVFQV